LLSFVFVCCVFFGQSLQLANFSRPPLQMPLTYPKGSRDHGGIRRDHGLWDHGNIEPEYHGISGIIYKFMALWGHKKLLVLIQ
jgi:hypothetical protein